MEEEKKVNEERNEVEETATEEVTAPAVVPEEPKKKGFLHIPTKAEKQMKQVEKLQRKMERTSLELVVTMEPDDKDSKERLAKMKHEDFVYGAKKTGAAVAAGVGIVTGVLFVASKVLRGHGTDEDAVDTTFEEVFDEGTSSEE